MIINKQSTVLTRLAMLTVNGLAVRAKTNVFTRLAMLTGNDLAVRVKTNDKDMLRRQPSR